MKKVAMFILMAVAVNAYGQDCEPCLNHWPKACDQVCLFSKLQEGSLDEWKLLFKDKLPEDKITSLYSEKEHLTPGNLSFSAFKNRLNEEQKKDYAKGIDMLNVEQKEYLKKDKNERKQFIKNYKMIMAK